MAKDNEELISHAVDWLKNNYKAPFKVNELASMVNMPVSTFHRVFKQITGESPLQYQKRPRLFEAQKLMLEGLDATRAAYAVGYESVTQFNREYKRVFGAPPLRNMKEIKAI